MTTITVNVIRKLSGNYTYTIDDTGRITYPEKPKDPETFRRVTRAKAPAAAVQAPAAKIDRSPARVQATPAPEPEPTPEPVQAPAPAAKIDRSPAAILAQFEQAEERKQALADAMEAEAAPTQAPPAFETVTLPARGTLESFQASAADLYRALKGYGKKSLIKLADYLFPAHILAQACKLAGKNESVTCRIDDHSETFRVYDKKERKTVTKTITCKVLIMNIGRAVYRFFDKTNAIPDGARMIKCTI